MGLGELLEVTARVAHLVSSAAWLGGSLFYALVLRPSLAGREEAPRVSPEIARRFGKIVGASAWALLASGGYLTFARLTDVRLGAPYALTLALKALLAVWMFLLAGALGRGRASRRLRPRADSQPKTWRALVPVPTLLLALGLIVFILSAILTTLYQTTP
jgi:putative copper export protein